LADDKTALDKLVAARQELLDGKNQEALEHAKASFAEVPSPNSAYIVGRAHQNLGHRTEALAAYRKAMALARRAADEDRWKYQLADEESVKQSAKLETELGRLVVLLPKGATATVDGKEPLELNVSSDRLIGEVFHEPGDVTLDVTLSTGQHETRRAHLFAGKTETLDIAAPIVAPPPPPLAPTVTPLPPPPDSVVWIPSLIAGTAALAALGTGVALHVVAQKDYDSVAAKCPVPAGASAGSVICSDASLESIAKRGHSEAVIGNVLFGVAGAAAGAGVVLAIVLNRRSDGNRAATALSFRGSQIDFEQRF
jgi:hypothetical protein